MRLSTMFCPSSKNLDGNVISLLLRISHTYFCISYEQLFGTGIPLFSCGFFNNVLSEVHLLNLRMISMLLQKQHRNKARNGVAERTYYLHCCPLV
jgi:hypothetical protein